jgi:non-specific serine/threonine protein kinase/serine/threonine-protein kinase
MSDPPQDRAGDAEPAEPTAIETRSSDGEAGAQIGPYRLLGKLGEGGMGEVWLAEQTAPVQRKVALKVIKQGMDTKRVVARFEAERQALATMDHPAVARVLDAGTTPHGRPYFVMEYIRGVPITEYCDRHRLTLRERLELFRRVCEGVQHAHQKAIIHRDLKPSNVLVAEQDGRRTPKIIDFGVAKATAQKLTERTMFTELGAMIGTPEYMSPEQAELTGEDVDTRTDVYSLGAILYELLVGALPFDAQELRRGGFDEIRRRLREEEPPRPSTRLSSLGDASGSSAAARRVDLPTLERLLRGDLDWIAMRALEKDRSRRYGAPIELSEDIGRYLADQPVLATPPAVAYRARKFVRRHRVATLAGLAILSTLVGATVVSSVLYVRAVRERAHALAAETRAKRVVAFLNGMLASADPFRSGDRNLTVVQMLDRATASAAVKLAGQPEVEAAVRQTIANTYHNLALYDQAAQQLKQSVDLAAATHGEDHPAVADTLHSLFWSLQKAGRYEEAETACRRALAIRRRLYGERDASVAESLDALGDLYRYMDRLELAEETLRRANELFLALPDPVPHIHWNDLALVLRARGKFTEAEPTFQKAIEAASKELGDDHPQTHLYRENLGLMLLLAARYDEAETTYDRTCRVWSASLGPNHQLTLAALHHFAETQARLGKVGQAEATARRAVEGYRTSANTDHAEYAHALGILGMIEIARGRAAESASLLREAVALRQRLAPDAWRTAEASSLLGHALALGGSFAEAEPLVLRSYERLRGIAAAPQAERDAVERIVAVYDLWDVARPHRGYDAKAAEWRARRP